jgi:hypothetical protein
MADGNPNLVLYSKKLANPSSRQNAAIPAKPHNASAIFLCAQTLFAILVAATFMFSAFSALADQYEDAREAAARKDFVTANAIWAELTNSGDMRAAYSLGLSYLKGRAVGIDPDRGVALIEVSAEAGNAPAQLFLSSLYQYGDYVQQDGKLAWYWAEKAAYQKFGPAQYALGTLYWAKQTRPDTITALMWMNLALVFTPRNDPQRPFIEVTHDQIRSVLTREEINQAESLARNWEKEQKNK